MAWKATWETKGAMNELKYVAFIGFGEADDIEYGTLPTLFDWRAFFDSLPDRGRESRG